MRIFDAPLKDCLEALGGAPYRVGEFAIVRHAQGFECMSGRPPRIAFSMPGDATLLDARRYVTIFNAGPAAGAESERAPGCQSPPSDAIGARIGTLSESPSHARPTLENHHSDART